MTTLSTDYLNRLALNPFLSFHPDSVLPKTTKSFPVDKSKILLPKHSKNVQVDKSKIHLPKHSKNVQVGKSKIHLPKPEPVPSQPNKYCCCNLGYPNNCNNTNTSTHCCQSNSKAPINTIAALLELEPGGIDGRVYNTLLLTFQYLGYSFPIYNTQASPEITLGLLEREYRRGIRIFIGFSRSTLLTQVKPWFDTHPKAIAISTLSTAASLAIIDNILRLVPNDNNIVTPLRVLIDDYKKKGSGIVTVLYQNGDVYSTDLARALEPYVNNTIATTLPQDIAIVTSALQTSSLIIPIYVEQYDTFVQIVQQYYINNPTSTTHLIDILNIEPPSNLNSIFTNRFSFLGNYNFLSLVGTEIYLKLGGESNPYVYDAVYIALQLQCNKINGRSSRLIPYISKLIGTSGALELQSTGDRKPIAYWYYTWDTDHWLNTIIFLVNSRDPGPVDNPNYIIADIRQSL